MMWMLCRFKFLEPRSVLKTTVAGSISASIAQSKLPIMACGLFLGLLGAEATIAAGACSVISCSSFCSSTMVVVVVEVGAWGGRGCVRVVVVVVVVVVVEGAVLVRGLVWTTTLTTADFLRWRRAVGSEGRLDWMCDTTEKGFMSVAVVVREG